MNKRKIEQSLRAADAGEAFHWPTIAATLAAEVRRLRDRFSKGTSVSLDLWLNQHSKCGGNKVHYIGEYEFRIACTCGDKE